jgi:predicted amidophosphoribosyltransferase
MKFCPQCGSTFEPDARFCLECGFDRSAVEQPEPAITSVSQTDAVPSQAGCPQCGSALSDEERFCQECGFDTTVTVLPIIEQPIQPAIVKDNFTPPKAVEEPVPLVVNKQFCPQCGSAINLDDRYCDDCGYDTTTTNPLPLEETEVTPFEKTVEPSIPTVVTEEPFLTEVSKQFCPRCGSGFNPADRFCDECGFDTVAGVVEPQIGSPSEAVPPKVSQPKPVIPPVSKPGAPVAENLNVPPVSAQPQSLPQKSKKAWVWALIALLGLAVIGTAGWFGYNKFIAKKNGCDFRHSCINRYSRSGSY